MDWKKSLEIKLSRTKISFKNLLMLLIVLYTMAACGIIYLVLGEV